MAKKWPKSGKKVAFVEPYYYSPFHDRLDIEWRRTFAKALQLLRVGAHPNVVLDLVDCRLDLGKSEAFDAGLAVVGDPDARGLPARLQLHDCRPLFLDDCATERAGMRKVYRTRRG